MFAVLTFPDVLLFWGENCLPPQKKVVHLGQFGPVLYTPQKMYNEELCINKHYRGKMNSSDFSSLSQNVLLLLPKHSNNDGEYGTPSVVSQKTKLFFDSRKDTLDMRCFHLFEAGLVYILYIIIHASGI